MKAYGVVMLLKDGLNTACQLSGGGGVLARVPVKGSRIRPRQQYS